ncbi:AAA family ATPase [Ornithinimicrobium cerasi]|uniref:AAA family ATPase n=1 Tax=Ornithinimicrobium cerasi TaxID=2248773 RepID=UPI000EFEC1C8|nr:AAA family ATPase [Ornithinimicrobium cerasi]
MSVTTLHAGPPPAHDRNPPGNDAYERAALGAALAYPRGYPTLLAEHTTASLFYQPAHENIWHAISALAARSAPIDPLTVGEELRRTKTLTRSGGQTYLHQLHAEAPQPEVAAYYVAEPGTGLHALAARRRAQNLALRLLNASDDASCEPDQLLATLREHLDAETARDVHGPTLPGTDVDTFLAQADDDHYDWLIPGFLERQDRAILTAGEGVGKSTMLRQWAVQTAAGIHPFTGEHHTPAKVLLLDLENSERQTRRKLRPLRIQAGAHLDPANLVVVCKVDGLDLTTDTDATWLSRLVSHHQPDLLITGPVYKLAGGDPTREEDSKPAAMALDRLRAEHDLTLLIEAHSAKANGGGKRPKEPYGWSGWLRWPEFGLNLSEEGDLTHWRGMRDERDIPMHFNRGGTWPWNPVINVAEMRWMQIQRVIQDAPKKLTQREIADATKIPQATVSRVMAEHAGEVTVLNHRHELEG